MAHRKPKRINMVGLAGVLGLVGCLGLVIAVFALLVGLWLDSLIGRRGPATICLLVLSVPLNLYVMLKLALLLMRHVRPLQIDATLQDDDEEV